MIFKPLDTNFKKRKTKMPIYVFQCDDCEHQIEVEQSIKKSTPNRKKCPECGKKKLKKLLFAPHVYNKPSDDKISVGLLADRNSERFSDEHKNSLDKKNGIKRENKEKKSFWQASKKNISDITAMTPKQKKKYIETGEK